MPKVPALAKFQKLVDDISFLYEKAKTVQVQFAWETGRRIVEEEQDGEIRAEYGSQLLVSLSKELTRICGKGFSESNLADMRKFYVQNRILRRAGKLPWTSHVALSRIPDGSKRRQLAQEAEKKGLTRDDVRLLVRKELGADGPQKILPPLVRPAGLKLQTFCRSKLNVKLPDSLVLLDCGFFVSWPVVKDALADLTITDKPSYTYAATLERVVDGDTLLVLIEVGFGIIVRDKLRLRGINCPERGTPEGEKAKKAVEKMLPAGGTIIIRSQKSDKYGRFVADVFYLGKDSSAQEILAAGSYLNQELLDKNLAERYD